MLRIRVALKREHDMVVNKRLVLSIMREPGIQGLPGPSTRGTDIEMGIRRWQQETFIKVCCS